MRYTVDGYLFIADDLLLLLNPVSNLPHDRVWFIPEKEIRTGDMKVLRECQFGMCDFFPSWVWWKDYRNESISVLTDMKQKGEKFWIFNRCFNDLKRINGAELRLNGGYSDIYYIPHRLSSDFLELSHLFLDHRVFLEIAVPSVIRCLTSTDIEPLPGLRNWFESRDHPWNFFSRSHLFGQTCLHPVKWSRMNEGSHNLTSMFCDYVIPYTFDPLARLNI